MKFPTRSSVFSIAAAGFLAQSLLSAPPEVPLYQRFLSPASPQEVVSARKVDRVAWVDYAEGKRNAYTAAAPLFTPVRLTNFTKDDGIMMSEIRISDDGSTVVFLRGGAFNRDGWAANPSADLGIQDDLYMTLPRGQSEVKTNVEVAPKLIAPLAADAKVGTLHVFSGKETLATVPLHPLKPVAAGGWWRRLIDTIRLWFA